VQLEKVPGTKGPAQQVAVPRPRKYTLRCQRPLQIIERVGELVQRDLDEAIGEHLSEEEQDTQDESQQCLGQDEVSSQHQQPRRRCGLHECLVPEELAVDIDGSQAVASAKTCPTEVKAGTGLIRKGATKMRKTNATVTLPNPCVPDTFMA
jgi:hypothetical protein